MSARKDYYREYKRKYREKYYQQEGEPYQRAMKTKAERQKEYRLRQKLKLKRQLRKVVKRPASFIDVDGTVLVPSPQRVRNILTLEERMRAIQAYDCRPMYTKVAKMFNCSWEQIKNIIANRDSIEAFYNAHKSIEKKSDPSQDDVKQKKIAFLGECMYEYIQRAQFHTNADLTEEMIRQKAFEFRDIILIENFTPNKAWINHFKATYNFSLANRQIVLTRTPPSSMDLKDIMTFCIKNKSKGNEVAQQALYPNPTAHNLYRPKMKAAINSANDAAIVEMKQRRQRKITFLEKALFEYIQRSTFHHKTVLNDETLRKVSYGIKDILKIENFFPNRQWVNHFRNRYAFTETQRNGAPPLSLDLKDILSYCSKCELKNNPPQNSVTLKPKLSVHSYTSEGSQNSVSDSLNNLGQQQPKVKEETMDLDADESGDELRPSMPEFLLGSDSDSDVDPPPLKIKRIETMLENGVHNETNLSNWSDNIYPVQDDPEPESEAGTETAAVHPTKPLRSYHDALKYLKPLEEFAMLEENYRVIGLVSQLEEIFKNPPKLKTDD